MPDVTLAGKAAATAEVSGDELNILQMGSVVTCDVNRVRDLLDQSDDGPVDEAWLLSVGGNVKVAGTVIFKGDSFNLVFDKDGIYLEVEDWSDSPIVCPVYYPKTRADVRHLLRLLLGLEV